MAMVYLWKNDYSKNRPGKKVALSGCPRHQCPTHDILAWVYMDVSAMKLNIRTLVHKIFIPALRNPWTILTVALTIPRPAVASGERPGCRKKSSKYC